MSGLSSRKGKAGEGLVERKKKKEENVQSDYNWCFITFFQHTCTYDLDTLSFFPPSRFSLSRLHMSVEWPTLNKYETNKQQTEHGIKGETPARTSPAHKPHISLFGFCLISSFQFKRIRMKAYGHQTLHLLEHPTGWQLAGLKTRRKSCSKFESISKGYRSGGHKMPRSQRTLFTWNKRLNKCQRKNKNMSNVVVTFWM